MQQCTLPYTNSTVSYFLHISLTLQCLFFALPLRKRSQILAIFGHKGAKTLVHFSSIHFRLILLGRVISCCRSSASDYHSCLSFSKSYALLENLLWVGSRVRMMEIDKCRQTWDSQRITWICIFTVFSVISWKKKVIICLGERKSSCHGEKEILIDVHDHCSKSCAKLKEFTLNLYCNVLIWISIFCSYIRLTFGQPEFQSP